MQPQSRPQNYLLCVGWDVKPYSLTRDFFCVWQVGPLNLLPTLTIGALVFGWLVRRWAAVETGSDISVLRFAVHLRACVRIHSIVRPFQVPARRQFVKSGVSTHGCHVSGISKNLEMSGNSAEVGEKSGKGPKSGKGQGMCVVGEI